MFTQKYSVEEVTSILNLEFVSTRLKVAERTTYPNFELRSYDETYLIYAVLMDFIEAQSVGDIF
jgi:hypothetical protein